MINGDSNVKEKDAPTAENNAAVTVKKLNPSERFTNAVMVAFGSEVSPINLTSFQKKLSQNYFIKLDAQLIDAEKKRLATKEEYRSDLAYVWENVNMKKLAIDVVCWSAIGLDPLQPNHINMLPYKNASSGKFDIGFIPGYKGAELKARKYGLDVPDHVVVELVHGTDKFTQTKKDVNNKVESYTFEVTNNFDRGPVVGGFYYHIYNDAPHKNKLKVFSRADIEKRKPDTASVEFWGGEKDEWKNGKKTGEKIIVDGWFEEMAYKTIYKAAYHGITIDSEKIDAAYVEVIKREAELIDNKVALEIAANANRQPLDFESQDVDYETVPASENTSAAPQATAENSNNDNNPQPKAPADTSERHPDAEGGEQNGPGF